MRIGTALLPLALALILVGCDGPEIPNPLVPSLQPLFTDADLDFDPALLDSFMDEKGEVTFTFAKLADTSYRLTVKELEGDKEVSGNFQAHLVRLGGYWFLDFFPDGPDIGDDFYKLHLLRAHSFARIWLQGDRLRIGLLSSDWLKKKIDEKSVEIDHQLADDSLLLTASTRELQDLLFRYATEEKAFGEPLDLHRCTDAEGTRP